MAGTERAVLKETQNPSSQSLLQLKVNDETSQFSSVNQSKVPKQSDAPQPNSDDCKASDPSDNQQDDQIGERVRPLAKADDQQDYGGGKRSTVDQIGIPISIAESETVIDSIDSDDSDSIDLDDYSIMQPNIRLSPENEVQIQMNNDIQAPAQARPLPFEVIPMDPDDPRLCTIVGQPPMFTSLDEDKIAARGRPPSNQTSQIGCIPCFKKDGKETTIQNK